jgi:hypothetical protein
LGGGASYFGFLLPFFLVLFVTYIVNVG